MRLSDDQIKEGLLHSDRELRTAIAYYYSRSFSSDPTIMPGVIRAIEQYGWADAFEAYNFLCELSQTEETVRWLIHQLQQYQPSDDERATRLRRDLQMALIHSDPLLLQKYEPQIKDLDSLDDEGRDAVDEQVSVPSESPAKLWTDLEELCELYSEDGSMPEDMFDFGGRLVKGLAQHQDVAERIGPILSDADQDENYWLTGFAIRLAGEMRLDTCVPRLVELGHDGDDWIKDEAFEALVKIGTADVVTQLAGDYSEADWEFRHATACYLENIHSDISVAMALRLFATEEDHGIRCSLLQSALMLFATEAIEPARQYVLISPKDPELLEVRHCLLLVCKLTGEQFPEFDAWLEDSKSDVEFRRQWYEDHPLRIGELDEFGDGDEVFDDDWEDGELADDLFADEADETSPVTFVRRGERIGRNDPCPCGSGKKYKNCCYRKGTADETDVNHAAAMSSVRQAQAPPKYPIGTVALYGPDDQRTTKIVAAVIRRYGDEPILQRWVGNKVKENPKVQRQIEEFFQKHVVKSVVASDGNMGCPHEEGEDFPMGEDCPFCPFWQGKQGTARRD